MPSLATASTFPALNPRISQQAPWDGGSGQDTGQLSFDKVRRNSVVYLERALWKVLV